MDLVFVEVMVPVKVTFDAAVSSCSRLGQGRLPRFDSFGKWTEMLGLRGGQFKSSLFWFPYYKVELSHNTF